MRVPGTTSGVDLELSTKGRSPPQAITLNFAKSAIQYSLGVLGPTAHHIWVVRVNQ